MKKDKKNIDDEIYKMLEERGYPKFGKEDEEEDEKVSLMFQVTNLTLYESFNSFSKKNFSSPNAGFNSSSQMASSPGV